jgi:hypothetical protein
MIEGGREIQWVSRSVLHEEARGVYREMKKWADIRFQVLREEKSKRSVLRETGMHWTTLKKILEHSEPPGYRLSKARPKPKIGPFLDRIADILESDKQIPNGSCP